MKAKLLIGYLLLGLSVAAVSCVVTTERPADSVPPPAPPPPPPAPAPTPIATATAAPPPDTTAAPPAPTATATATAAAPASAAPPPKRSEFKSAPKKATADGGTTTGDGGS